MRDEIVGDLTAEEIYEFDNLAASKKGLDSALTVALNFHTNQRSLLERDAVDLWRRLTNRLGIPEASHEVGYKIERRQGMVSVVEIDPQAEPWRLDPA